MTKERLLQLLNRLDIPGVGVVAYYNNGTKCYYFYEDFDSKNIGVDRAKNDFSDLISKGYVEKVEYIHKDYTTVHFWDWDSKNGSFCAKDEYNYFNKCNGLDYYNSLFGYTTIINGLEYTYDYTPSIDGISAIVATRKNK